MSDGTGTAAVVITYNRKALLLECLAALKAQTVAPARIYVWDNASTDGTEAALADAGHAADPAITIIRSAKNLGGAGGFHHAMRRAHADGHRWLWLMDDDTIPAPDALERLLEGLAIHEGGDPPVWIACSRVRWTDGQAHLMNLVGPKTGFDRDFLYDAAAAGHISIRTCSFVSCLVHRDALTTCGLPIAEYFIWNDDVEFTARILRDHRGICVPASEVVHKTRTNYGTLQAPPERFRYHVRNQLHMNLRSRAFRRGERLRNLFAYAFTLVAWGCRNPFEFPSTIIPWSIKGLFSN